MIDKLSTYKKLSRYLILGAGPLKDNPESEKELQEQSEKELQEQTPNLLELQLPPQPPNETNGFTLSRAYLEYRFPDLLTRPELELSG